MLRSVVTAPLPTLALRTLASLLALALLLLLIWQYADRTTRSLPGAPQSVPEAVLTPPTALTPLTNPCPWHGAAASLRLLVRRLNLRDGVVTVDPTLCIPAQVVQSLGSNYPRAFGPHGPVAQETELGLVIRRPFRDDEIGLALSSVVPPIFHMQWIKLGSLEAFSMAPLCSDSTSRCCP